MPRFSIALCALVFSFSAAAQTFPQPGRPVRIVVPFPAPWDAFRDFTPITVGIRIDQ